MSVSLGITDLHVATSHFVLSLDDLAASNGTEPAKYHLGLGQDQFSVPAPDEDVVTLGAAAARPIVERNDNSKIRTLLFATESGIDQSKSAGVFVHHLLGLPSNCRAVELKQACYSATAAIQSALGIVALNPEEQVLVIAADIARYDLDSSAEPTQGAGAVAMLISANPKILEIEPITGVHTADVADFWRPNDRTTAIVDGKLSTTAYLDSLLGAWRDYQERGGHAYADIDRFGYHQPFVKMAMKAHRALVAANGADSDDSLVVSGYTYGREVGNTYTASLFFALAALLDAEDLTGKRIGLFSYGSGSVGEFFTGVVQGDPHGRERKEQTVAAVAGRTPISVADYRELHQREGLHAPSQTPRVTQGPYRFAGTEGDARRYEVR